MTRPDRRYLGAAAAIGVAAGFAAAVYIAVGALIVSLPAGTPSLPWFPPLAVVATVVCLAVTSWLALLDARLRERTDALPVAGAGVALGVLSLASMVIFPDAVPSLTGNPRIDPITSSLPVVGSLAAPTLLAAAALQRPRHVANGARAARWALAIGLAVGAGLVLLAVGLGVSPAQSAEGDRSAGSVGLLGLAGVLPVTVTPLLLAGGRRGRDRIAGGMLPALVLSGLNCLLLVFPHTRYSPAWYAAYVLPLGVGASLLFGQLDLHRRSVRADLGAAGRLEASFGTAEALASSLQPDVVIDRLLERGMVALHAERALFCRVSGDDVVVEGSRAVGRPSCPVGAVHPLSETPWLEAAVRGRRAETAGAPIGRDRIRAADSAPAAGVGQALAVPLLLDHEVLGVLAVVRAGDVPFGPDDRAAAGTIANLGALALRNARQFSEAEEVSRAKSLSLNVAAHDLRTPLSVVRGYMSMLRDGSLGPLPGDARLAVGILQSKADELSRLVETVLMADRIDSGRARPRPQMLDVGAAVEAAVARLAPSAELRRAEVEVSVPAEPVLVLSDADHLARILDNLLANALTYSEDPPWLRIALVVAADGRALVSVEDRGVGLRDEDHERIFQRCERVEHPQLGFPPGTGLGLYLSRRLAEAMDGAVRLEHSSVGEGSRFVLDLPAVDPRHRELTGATRPDRH